MNNYFCSSRWLEQWNQNEHQERQGLSVSQVVSSFDHMLLTRLCDISSRLFLCIIDVGSMVLILSLFLIWEVPEIDFRISHMWGKCSTAVVLVSVWFFCLHREVFWAHTIGILKMILLARMDLPTALLHSKAPTYLFFFRLNGFPSFSFKESLLPSNTLNPSKGSQICLPELSPSLFTI